MHERSMHLRLTAVPHACREARHAARVVLEDWDVPDVVREDAVLVISELVTNAVRHTGEDSSVELDLQQREQLLRVALKDESSTLPTVRAASTTQENGRGLRILASLSDRWGVEPGPDGKRVWWEVDLPQRPTDCLAAATASA